MSARILIVDDEPAVRLGFRAYLTRAGFDVVEADSLAQARQAALVNSGLDAVLLDVLLPDGSGLDWVTELRDVQPGLIICVMTGHADVPTAVEAMRRGADQFVPKPVNMAELDSFLQTRLERTSSRRGPVHRHVPEQRDMSFGTSPAAQRLRELAALAAQNGSATLLQGETGSGKSLLARWIHDHSARATRPFVAVSCGVLRGELLVSELFGHARGAFTSAQADKPGLLDVADGGTLFLDEVGELEANVQSQFLKVLEEKRYRRLGEVAERKSEFRLICATNGNLRHDTESGRFRTDLYFRVNVFPIDVPPLRTRPEDIPSLVNHLLATLTGGRSVVVPEVLERLQAYGWPGNVRELRNVLERALLLARGDTLGPEHFRHLEMGGTRSPDVLEQERDWLLRSAIRNSGGNVAAAAQALGVSRATLYRRLQRLRES